MRMFKKTTAPTVNDDYGSGYLPDDIWIDGSTRLRYICLGNERGSARWQLAYATLRVDGIVVAGGEYAPASAGTFALATQVTPCKRIWIGAPAADHAAGTNTSNVLVGTGLMRFDYTGQPADTETLTIGDGINTAIVYEWDNNSTYTAGRTPVTIGADADASYANLVTAINASSSRCFAWQDATNNYVYVQYVATVTDASGNVTVGVDINRIGSLTLAKENLVGFWWPCNDASWVYVTTLSNGDGIEYQLFGN